MQRIAAQAMAIETLRRGYDGFMVLDGQYSDTVAVVGYTPVTTTTTGNAYTSYYGGAATTTYSANSYSYGGIPIFAGEKNQGYVIQMFRDGSEGYEQAVPARQVLGPDWATMVESGPASVCLQQ